MPALLLALLFAASAGPEVPTKTPAFEVRTIRGSLVKGTWRRMKTDWSVVVGEGDGTLVSGPNILSVRRDDTPLPPLPTEPHLILANGDRIPFRSLRLVDEKVHFHHANLADGQEASCPWRLFVSSGTPLPIRPSMLRNYAADSSSARERAIPFVCAIGDVVAGVLTRLDAANAVVEVDQRQVTVKIAQAAYIAFNTELADALRPKGRIRASFFWTTGWGGAVISP